LHWLPDSAGQGPYWCAWLDEPLKYRIPAEFDTNRCQHDYLDRDEQSTFLWIVVIVFRIRSADGHLRPDMHAAPADLAYVVDNTLGYDTVLDPTKVDFVAHVDIDSTYISGDGPAPPTTAQSTTFMRGHPHNDDAETPPPDQVIADNTTSEHQPSDLADVTGSPTVVANVSDPEPPTHIDHPQSDEAAHSELLSPESAQTPGSGDSPPSASVLLWHQPSPGPPAPGTPTEVADQPAATTPMQAAELSTSTPAPRIPQLPRADTDEPAEHPDITRARQLIWECLWGGRQYSNLQWAIGLHRGDGNATKFYIASSEGFPYIPQNVYLPDSPSLATVFDDHEFVAPERTLELAGWRNPAWSIAAHHRLRADADRSTLWAIVSTMPLDTSARLSLPADVQLVEVNPDPEQNPLQDSTTENEIPNLTENRRHRLAVAAPALWPLIEQVHRRWQAALDLVVAADSATREWARSTGPTFSGAALLDDVLAQLEGRQRPTDETVAALQSAYSTTVAAAQAAQRTPENSTDDPGHVDAYRRARAWEAAVILVDAVNNHGNDILAETTLADITYCTVAARLHHSAGNVAGLLRNYA
jgi:hypothetical protein